MKWSHSKLSKILSCPMSYMLSYEQGIQPIVEKTALAVGSAVHWGIEHDTEDLTKYFIENGTFTQGQTYTREQLLAEAMVHGYLINKEKIFDEILKDEETGEQLKLIKEEHEFFITGILPSKSNPDSPHDFIGIIDLRLLTNKGYIIIDYKTSTFVPHWEDYLDQIYRYIFMNTTSEPDVPVYKCGIVNIRKTGIRQKSNESEFDFLRRLKHEYEVKGDESERLINVHMYPRSTIDNELLEQYVDNLSKMADTAELIIENKAWFINYGAANGQYGKSEFWDIFYHRPNIAHNYSIADWFYDLDDFEFKDRRVCKDIDMQVIDRSKILNKFTLFRDLYSETFGDVVPDVEQPIEEFKQALIEAGWLVDDELFYLYYMTLIIKLNVRLPEPDCGDIPFIDNIKFDI